MMNFLSRVFERTIAARAGRAQRVAEGYMIDQGLITTIDMNVTPRD